jgi:hypothetical protein
VRHFLEVLKTDHAKIYRCGQKEGSRVESHGKQGRVWCRKDVPLKALGNVEELRAWLHIAGAQGQIVETLTAGRGLRIEEIIILR